MIIVLEREGSQRKVPRWLSPGACLIVKRPGKLGPGRFACREHAEGSLQWEMGSEHVLREQFVILILALSQALRATGQTRPQIQGWWDPTQVGPRPGLWPSVEQTDGLVVFPTICPLKSSLWLGDRFPSTSGVKGCLGVVPINYQTLSLWL